MQENKDIQEVVEVYTSSTGGQDLEQAGIDQVAEQHVARKLDLHITPIVMLLYLFSFLDRVNIGNASFFGLEKDLNLTEGQYRVALLMLFVTYILYEGPSNLVPKKFRPSRWIAFIVTSWGIIATCTGLTQNFASLIVCRLLLGLFEGGLFPGLAVYLTFLYTKKELALRIGYLFACVALSGRLGVFLAFGIGCLDGVAGLSGWRWIIILEGIPAFILGITAWFLLPNDPRSAYFLSTEEKRSCRRGSTANQASPAPAQALTAPPYALGAISYIVVASIPDRQQQKGLYVLLCGIISMIGYGVLIADVSSAAHYFACFLIATGLYVLLGIPLSWLSILLPRYRKRTTATGLQLAVSNMSGILVPFLYVGLDGPRHVMGHGVTLALVGLATACAAAMSLYLSRVNAARVAEKEDYKMAGKMEEIFEMGDESPRFMYTP